MQRAIHESRAPEVEPQAEQHVCVLERREPGPLQQALMHVDGAADLTFLAIQVAENHGDLERRAVAAGGLRELLDGEIDLIGDHEIEADQVMRRLPCLSSIDPSA